MNILKASSTEEIDNFKRKFKYYKTNLRKLSYSDVISQGNSGSNDEITDVTINNSKEDSRTHILGLQSISQWKISTFRKHPGLLLIRNPFTALGQRYWIKRCLEEYPRKPNKMNIDIDMTVQDWWAECFVNGHCNRHLQKKLRWTTLGYHHNWDTKVYSEEQKSKFPEDLAELSDVIAQCLGYHDFKAEAAIINYYHMDSTLSAHTDHSEMNLKAPLFSFSFGQTAIFLIGGKDKSIEPTAIFLNSGDIVVMSEEARLCYHAVPKILPASTTPWNEDSDIKTTTCSNINFKYIQTSKEIKSDMYKTIDNEDWSDFNSYIEQSRVNMNVRQVLNKNQINLCSNFHNV